jgi:Tol biopolymer transport system component
VLHRWQRPGDNRWYTRCLTANPDGSAVYPLADEGYFSHYHWYSPTQVIAWSRHAEQGTHYFLYTDQTDQLEIIGEAVFSVDGHCSFSPNREWLITDTYPDEAQMRTLILFHLASGRRIDIGRFYAPPELQGPVRCDLHPRWSRDGKMICFDSAHEGTRQVYVINATEIVG